MGQLSLLPLALGPEADESFRKGDLWSVAALLSTISGAWLCCGSVLFTVSSHIPHRPLSQWPNVVWACCGMQHTGLSGQPLILTHFQAAFWNVEMEKHAENSIYLFIYF